MRQAAEDLEGEELPGKSAGKRGTEGTGHVHAARGAPFTPELLLERSVRRVVMHFPAAFPWRRGWSQSALAVGATP